MTTKDISCPLKETDVTIVRNLGDFRTYWTVEVETKFTKKEAEQFYTYISLYHNYLMTKQKEGREE